MPALISFVAAGLSIAIVGGWVFGHLVVESTTGQSFDDRIQMGVEEVGTILRRIWPHLLVGIDLGAVIHGWVPANFFTTHAAASNSR